MPHANRIYRHLIGLGILLATTGCGVNISGSGFTVKRVTTQHPVAQVVQQALTTNEVFKSDFHILGEPTSQQSREQL